MRLRARMEKNENAFSHHSSISINHRGSPLGRRRACLGKNFVAHLGEAAGKGERDEGKIVSCQFHGRRAESPNSLLCRQRVWGCWWVRAGMVVGGERVWGALAKRKWAGCAGNSPAIHRWEKAGASGQSPGRDGGTVLSSLRDSLAWVGGVPSAEVPGYFQAAPVFAGRWLSDGQSRLLGCAE